MKNYNFGFYVTEKVRSQYWGTALAAGAHQFGDTVELVHKDNFTISSERFDGGGKLGLSRSAKCIMGAYLDSGKHFLFFDKGYFGRGAYWRVSIDAWQPLAYFQRFKRSFDRWDKFNTSVKDRSATSPDSPIVLAGACQNYSNFCNLGNVNDFNLEVLKNIRANTLRPILYRPNPSWYLKHADEFRPVHEQVEGVTLSVGGLFTDVLNDCHLVVTHGTGAAVTAVLNGVPSLVMGEGAAKPVSMGPEWESIEEPVWLDGKVRKQYFADLAYCQWTIEEFRSGQAWEEIRLALAYLEGPSDRVQTGDLIRQYEIMHASPKYFRGVNTAKYRSEIGFLILKTSSNTLLDYGSGKGDQYKHPYNLHDSWGVEVTCYDPAVPGINEKPTGKYDGVICCDVMEHIPDHSVDAVIKNIFSLANKFVFFVITNVPAKKQMPDGRNCHVTVEPNEWWLARIGRAKPAGIELKVIMRGTDADD